MGWGKRQIALQAVRTAREDYAAFEAVGLSEIDDAHVLDVGCFDGGNTVLKFKPYGNIERVVGIDPCAEEVEEACQRAAALNDVRFEFRVSSFEEYETDEQFDVVYFSHVLQHVADPKAACEKALCLLKPGGWIIVKTVDDSLKVSYPDPDNVMRRLFSLYETYVLPETEHTRHTDRYNGQKCYTLMRQAGFGNVAVQAFSVDTAGKSPEERKALFERCVYFRRNVSLNLDAAIAERVQRLVQAWGELFERDDYYFMSQSVVAVGQKPFEGEVAVSSDCSGGFPCAKEPDGFCGLLGERFDRASHIEAARLCERSAGGADAECAGWVSCGNAGASDSRVSSSRRKTKRLAPEGGIRIRPMREDDLGQVMAIEIEAFPDPWTPVAYAMDLRHNPAARYDVALDEAGAVVGYIGWWLMGERACIMHIATSCKARGKGVGRELVARACAEARGKGAHVMQLDVRESNATARSFYRGNGFEDAGVACAYYSNPDEDAVLMVRPL